MQQGFACGQLKQLRQPDAVALQSLILQHLGLHTGSPQASHWLLQVLFLFAGLSSCDPGGIWDSIKQAKQQKCRVSVVGLAAEVFICREITKVSCSCW